MISLKKIWYGKKWMVLALRCLYGGQCGHAFFWIFLTLFTVRIENSDSWSTIPLNYMIFVKLTYSPGFKMLRLWRVFYQNVYFLWVYLAYIRPTLWNGPASWQHFNLSLENWSIKRSRQNCSVEPVTYRFVCLLVCIFFVCLSVCVCHHNCKHVSYRRYDKTQVNVHQKIPCLIEAKIFCNSFASFPSWY